MKIYDRAEVTNSKRVFTDEGYLKVPAIIARTGFYDYRARDLGWTDRDPDDIVVIYRSPEEVFKDSSMQSFANKPVTDDHPNSAVNVDNIKQYQKGFSCSEVKKVDNSYLETTLIITDRNTIEKVKDGKIEISNGYDADVVKKDGYAEGRKYDGYQTNIRGNHIAIVDVARAGRKCKIADANNNNNEVEMKKFIHDGVSFEASEQVADVVAKLQSENTILKDSVTTAKTNHQKELDVIQAKLDDAESKILTDADIQKKVAKRQALIADAEKIAGLKELESKSDKEIVLAVLDSKNIVVDGKSDDYIDARFDALKETKVTVTDGSEKVKVTEKSSKTEDEDEEDEKIKKKQMNDSATAWMKNVIGAE